MINVRLLFCEAVTMTVMADYAFICIQVSQCIPSSIGVILGKYEGYAYPHFLEWGYRTPTF